MAAQSDPWMDGVADESEFTPLSRQQAQILQRSLGGVCLTCAWVWQGGLAVFALALAWLLGLPFSVWCSALAGVLAAWLPQALFLLGAGRKIGQMAAAAWLVQLFCWEAVKLVLTLVLMALAAVWIRDVSWWALLLAFIFTLKVGWGALFVQHLRRGSLVDTVSR
jgi:ATP synthase protein I